MDHNCLPSAFRARGFTLIEALVALLVLSIGLLGVAALQLTSLKYNQGASQRSQATMLASDIIDRMRANRAAALAQEYRTEFGENGAAGTQAGRDLIVWKNNIRRTLPAGLIGPGLPNPDGSIDFDAATRVFTVTIAWNDSRTAAEDAGVTQAEADATVATFAMSTRLN